jgi:hypothetical protein
MKHPLNYSTVYSRAGQDINQGLPEDSEPVLDGSPTHKRRVIFLEADFWYLFSDERYPNLRRDILIKMVLRFYLTM